MLIHPSFLLFILNNIVITFEQFFGLNKTNSATLHATGRNERRNLFNPKVAKDKKISGQRKTIEVESLFKGMNPKPFLSNDRAFTVSKEYGINLPEEGQRVKINSNSDIYMTKEKGKFYLSKQK
jgi:hypothetical protein